MLMRWESPGGVLPQTGTWDRDVKLTGDAVRPRLSREPKEDDRALLASEQMYRDLVENANDLIYVINLQGNFTSINRAAQRVSGYTRAEALKMNIAQLVASEYLDAARQMMQKALRGEPATTYDLEIVTKDGRRVMLEISHRLLLENGIPRGTHAIARDITERRKMELLERDRIKALEMIATRQPIEQILNQLAQMVERQCPGTMAAVSMLRDNRLYPVAAPGLPEGFVQGMKGIPIGPTAGSCGAAAYWGRPVFAGDIASDPLWDEHRELALAHQLASCWSVPILAGSGKALGTFAVYQRIPSRPDKAQIALLQMSSGSAAIAIEQRQLTDQLAYQAHHDALTSLPNRLLFQERLRQSIVQARRSGTMIALLYLDLDRFKLVNDTLGHAGGDELLRQVARRLKSCLRETDTLARMSGDEFTILAAGLRNAHHASLVAESVLKALRDPFHTENQELYITASIGISVYPQDAMDAETLQRNADNAMYRAKSRGKNRVEYFIPEMSASMAQRLEIETHLRYALDRGEFCVHYQPQFDLQSGKLVGQEALLRWTNPKLGSIAPDQFIPIAEENGLIVPIGAWVLQEACRQTSAWRKAGYPLRGVSVNVSAVQFGRPDFVDTVRDVLHDSGLDPCNLELELTESLIIRDVRESARKMEKIRALGVQISVDDFGAGYSSLSYLQRLPIDILKLDRSFVEEFKTERGSSSLVQGIVSLAHGLGMRVTAEGVETEQQLELVHHSGCDKVQGYLLGRPSPAPSVLSSSDCSPSFVRS
jgi:diguanylate cyclase (GGDEF)-like protein/PAS domain S-box-containing protein